MPRSGGGSDNGRPGGGPSIMVPPVWNSGKNRDHPLAAAERAAIAVIATVVRIKKSETIYREDEPANFVFNMITGVAKSYKLLPRRRQHIIGFWFCNDLIGLAHNGRYVNSAAAVTDATMYRISASAFETRLRQCPEFDFQIISKLCYDLRETQRHAFLLSRQHAITKIALFIQMLEIHQAGEQHVDEVSLPMTQSDIGSYVGLSTEVVNRSFRELVNRGAIRFENRRYLKIIDRAALEAAISKDDGRK